MRRKGPLVLPPGVHHMPGLLDRAGQGSLVETIRAIILKAPLYRPVMPGTGRPFSVRMSNCGPLGWVSDQKGYRYQSAHPETGQPWPSIPQTLLDLWRDYSGDAGLPDACLINFYDDNARMGLHQDRDEEDFSAPVLSVSLGDTCLFRIGGTKRQDPTQSFRLESGDLLVLGGAGRLAFHGVDRLYPGTSTLLKNGGRINLTLRRVRARAD